MVTAPEMPAPQRSDAPDLATAIDAATLEDSLASTDAGRRDLVLAEGLAAWLSVDPPGAARFAELQADPFLREIALRTVAQRWAEFDPVSTAQWATSLGDETGRDQAIEAAALAIAHTDAPGALDLLARRYREHPVDAARTGVVASWAHRDFAAAQSWLEAQPRSAARDQIVQRLVLLRARQDPQAAMMLANQMISSEAARRDASASLTQLMDAGLASPRGDAQAD